MISGFLQICLLYAVDQPRGGGTQVQMGAAPALRISRKKGSFL